MLVTSLYSYDWQHGVRYFVKRRPDAKSFFPPLAPMRGALPPTGFSFVVVMVILSVVANLVSRA